MGRNAKDHAEGHQAALKHPLESRCNAWTPEWVALVEDRWWRVAGRNYREALTALWRQMRQKGIKVPRGIGLARDDSCLIPMVAWRRKRKPYKRRKKKEEEKDPPVYAV